MIGTAGEGYASHAVIFITVRALIQQIRARSTAAVLTTFVIHIDEAQENHVACICQTGCVNHLNFLDFDRIPKVSTESVIPSLSLPNLEKADLYSEVPCYLSV